MRIKTMSYESVRQFRFGSFVMSRDPGVSWWFRVFGYGLCFLHDSCSPGFSERNSRKWKRKRVSIPLTAWRVGYLTRKF